jgi:hypothetical protein
MIVLCQGCFNIAKTELMTKLLENTDWEDELQLCIEANPKEYIFDLFAFLTICGEFD